MVTGSARASNLGRFSCTQPGTLSLLLGGASSPFQPDYKPGAYHVKSDCLRAAGSEEMGIKDN